MWIGSVVLDSNDTEMLSEFYKNLLGWEKSYQGNNNEWIIVMDKNHKSPPLVFQLNPIYVPPAYPPRKDAQQQMTHIDFYVTQEEMEEKMQLAIKYGAVKAGVQCSDDWTVMIDPSGHPFCMVPISDEMAANFQ